MEQRPTICNETGGAQKNTRGGIRTDDWQTVLERGEVVVNRLSSSDFYVWSFCLSPLYSSVMGEREYRIHSEGRTCRDSRLSWVKNRFFLDDRLFSLSFNWSICLPSSFSPSLLVQLCCDLGLNTNQLSSLMDSEYNKKKERNDWPSTPYNFYLGFDRPHWNRSTLCYSIE